MFSFVKAMSDSSPSASSTGKPPPMTTHNTFGSQELFEAWAKDSFINQSTIDILVKTHEIDCLPAVLALKKEDFPDLNLPVGQRRLLENAVEKLRQECELVQPPTPKAKINLEMPSYKSMLEIGEPFDEEEVLRHSGAFQRKSTSVHDFRGRDIGQKILEHAKSHTKTEKDEDNYGPEKEALLVSQKRKSSPQMQSGLKTDGSRSPKNFDEDSDNEESTACACQRWLFVTVFMPLFLVLSILGFLLLMILAPFRVCCPKGGVYSNTVTFLFEVFLMAPCVACKWASGKRKRNSALGKPRYGGTNDVELGNK